MVLTYRGNQNVNLQVVNLKACINERLDKRIVNTRKFPDFKFLISLINFQSFRLKRNKHFISNSQNILDLRNIAKKNTPKIVFDYVEGGALEEVSYKRSIDAFKNTEFPAKVLQKVRVINTSQKVLGKNIDLPVIFAPTGYTRMMHHTGELAVARVALQKNLIYVLSTMGTTSPEELAIKIPQVRRWMQIYIMRDRSETLKLVNSAKKNGFEALMVTVDTPVTGIKIRDLRNGLTVPPKIGLGTVFSIATKPLWWFNLLTTKKLEFAAFKGWDKGLSELANLIFSSEVTEKDIHWLKSIWNGPLIVKGIQSVYDAKKVAALGVSALVVSNHGGRQLDRSPTPLEILHDIVKAVGSRVEVYIDGGILNGQDVYAAVALGAKGVLIGRSYLYGLMAGGELGVHRVVDILERDLRNTMALTGNTNLVQVKKAGAKIRKN